MLLHRFFYKFPLLLHLIHASLRLRLVGLATPRPIVHTVAVVCTVHGSKLPDAVVSMCEIVSPKVGRAERRMRVCHIQPQALACHDLIVV